MLVNAVRRDGRNLTRHGAKLKRAALAAMDYARGFLALAVFAALAFGKGQASDEQMVCAFKVGAAIAAFELAVLFWRQAPDNGLMLGANLWLMAGGAAAALEQWWWPWAA